MPPKEHVAPILVRSPTFAQLCVRKRPFFNPPFPLSSLPSQRIGHLCVLDDPSNGGFWEGTPHARRLISRTAPLLTSNESSVSLKYQ
jgi:hypothetical protein